MLLVINEFNESIKAQIKPKMKRALESILDAHVNGHHFVYIKPKIGDFIANNFDLNERYASILNMLIEQFPQYGNLLSNAKVFAYVTWEDYSTLRRERNVIKIPYNDILTRRILDKTVLVVESISSDWKVVEVIFKAIQKLKSLPGNSHYVAHGGGGNIISVLNHNCDEERRLVAVLIDSDRNCVNDTVSYTARKILSYASERPCVGAVTTVGREIENVIPIEILRKTKNSYARNDTISYLKKNDAGRESISKFFDLKNGIDRSRYNEKDCNNSACKNCFTSKNPRNIPGLGDKIIDNIFADHQIAGELEKYVLRHPKWQSECLEEFEILYWWGVSAPIQIVS